MKPVWSEKETVLYLDGLEAARGEGVVLEALTAAGGTPGWCLGTDAQGARPARGLFDEVFTFARACSAAELAAEFQRTTPLTALGPITPEEETQQREAALAARAAAPPAPSTRPEGRESMLESMGDCASELFIERGTNVVVLTVTNATAGRPYDLYRTFHLLGDSITNSHWLWVTQVTNGQRLGFPTGPCSPVFYVLGCTNDTDADGLSDAFEVLVNKTSPETNHSINALFTDLEMVNVLVNDPEQDCGNEQNTQSETTIAALGSNILVAWVDSNLGRAGYGIPGAESYIDPVCSCASNCPPQTNLIQFIGWAISQDGGETFVDKGGLPYLTNAVAGVSNILGNGGDPVLAVDSTLGTFHLVGNSQRPGLYYPNGTNSPAEVYLPLWRSTNGGQSFDPPINTTPGLLASSTTDFSDKPALLVDPFPGAGQGTVYLAFFHSGGGADVLFSSTPGGTNWTNRAVLPAGAYAASLTIASNHDLYLAWRISTTGNPVKIAVAKSTNQAQTVTVLAEITLNSTSHDLGLTRSIGSPGEESFRCPIFPYLLVNPSNASHLYLVYNDKGSAGSDKADIFFRSSSDGGTNWSTALRVNTDATTNDQWQPVLTIKPDGTRLFIAWQDRREDTINNSLIRPYGVFVDLPVSGTNSFSDNFPIAAVQFPAVFTGTNQIAGRFDPAYPPNFEFTDPGYCYSYFGTYKGHMGDYDGVICNDSHIFLSWADNRNLSTSKSVTRNQADVRMIKIAW